MTDEKTNGKLTVTGPIMNEQTLIMSVKIDAEGLNYLYEEYVLENLLLAKGAAEMLMKHPLTDIGLKKFLDDWNKSGAKI